MKRIYWNLFLTIMGIFITSQYAVGEEKSPLSGKLGVSYSGSQGNTDEDDFSLNAKVVYSGKKWKHSLNGELSIYENSGTRLSEEIDFSYNAAYFFNKKQYFFNHMSYERDIAENIDRRLIEAIGYGHIFIKEDGHNLTGEVGIGKRKTFYLVDKDDDLETVGYLGAFYDKKLTDNISVEEELVIVGSSDNVVSKSVTALNFSVTENMSVGLEYKITHTSNPPVENDKTDTTTDILFRYSF